MKSRFLISLLIISFIAQQCAKQTAPTGGPKDETPPKLLKSDPVNEETSFNKEKIELTFDEYIQLNNPREQVLITPSIGKKFEATARKNKVVLEFKSNLQDSTTYNINFRESIKDLNEKNPATVKIAFSTGNYIDSLSMAGQVKDVLTGTEAKNYTVALTQESDTFNIFKHQASWITQTDNEGKFLLENLKQGKYLIYAFTDNNKNLIVDSKSEKYGFSKNIINLKNSIDTLHIQVFKLDASAFKLISAKPIFSYYLIRLTKGIFSYKLEHEQKTERIYSVLEPDKTSIRIFNTLEQKADSVLMNLIAYDSSQNKIDTLIYLKFTQKESKKENIQAKADYTKYLETRSTMESSITFSKPIPFINKDSIFIQLDSLNKITFSDQDFKWNESLTKLTISKKYQQLKEGTQQRSSGATPIKKATGEPTKQTPAYNELTFPKGTFISVELDTIPKLSQPVRYIKLEETGVILSKTVTNENFILQLISRTNEVIEEVHNNKEHKFENIQPGTYLLRAIIDMNKNGRWDPGDIPTRSEPEPVIYYINSKNEKEINLKANWEVGPLLITY